MDRKLSPSTQAIVNAWAQAKKTQTRTAGRYSALAAALRALANVAFAPLRISGAEEAGEQRLVCVGDILAIARQLDPITKDEEAKQAEMGKSSASVYWILDALASLRGASIRYRLGVYSQEELQIYEERAKRILDSWGYEKS
jgi:hypothetical protein